MVGPRVYINLRRSNSKSISKHNQEQTREVRVVNGPGDDWESSMTPKERAEWEEFVRHVREETIRGLDRSAIAILFTGSDENADIKLAVQLGLCVMKNKPIMLVVPTGVTLPYKMRKVADEVVYADIDTEAGARRVTAAAERMKKRFGE